MDEEEGASVDEEGISMEGESSGSDKTSEIGMWKRRRKGNPKKM